MRIFLPLLLALAASAQPAPPRADVLDALIEKTRQAFNAPGLAVAIVKDDQIVYLKGFGTRVLGQSDPVTADTRFAMASNTKAVATTALAILAAEGKLDWDDPVSKYIPTFRLADPSANALVTLRDLASHRTGLSRNDNLWDFTSWPRAELIDRIGQVPLAKPFRSTYQYQNLMFMAAGEAAARAASTTWEQLVQTRILSPLGMTNTGFSAKDGLASPNHALPHNKRKGVVTTGSWTDISTLGPAGSMNSSARDLSRWIRFHINGGSLDGRRLLPEKALRETHSPQMVIRDDATSAELNPETNFATYGLGWRVQDFRGRLLVNHGGAIDGFRSNIGFLPKEKIGYVILTNVGVSSLVEALRYTILDHMLGTETRDWCALYQKVLARQQGEAEAAKQKRLAARVPDTKPSLALGAYAGNFKNPGYGAARVAFEPGGLLLEWGNLKLHLKHWHYDTFQTEDDDSDTANTAVLFRLNDDGLVAGLRLFGQEFAREPSK